MSIWKMENRKWKIILISLLGFLLIGLFPQPAEAEGITLSVSPSLLRVQIRPPAEAKASISIQNLGEDSVNLDLKLIPFRPSGDTGDIEYFDQNAFPDEFKKISKKIIITDQGLETSSIVLGPKQQKKLELQFIIPKDEIEADYYFSVIFFGHNLSQNENTNENEANTATPSAELPVEPELNTNLQLDSENNKNQNTSTINTGIAANVLLSIGTPNGSNFNSPLQASDIELTSPAFVQSGPVNFTLKIINRGRHVISPRGMILVKNIFGQIIGRIDLESANILAGASRSLSDSQTATSSSQLSPLNSHLSTPTILWPEKFLLGPYTATLNLAVSDEGPLVTKTIIFTALPVQILASSILLILFTAIIILRLKYRLKNDK